MAVDGVGWDGRRAAPILIRQVKGNRGDYTHITFHTLLNKCSERVLPQTAEVGSF